MIIYICIPVTENNSRIMKKNTHPENYRLVVFKDMSNGDTFITKSCADTKDTIKIDGKEYPLIKREISSSSHPFYTGKMKLVDTAGRVDKFYKKFGKSALAAKSEQAPAAEAPAPEETPAEETPTAETPVDETPTAEAPVEETPTAEAPAPEETPAEEDSDKE